MTSRRHDLIEELISGKISPLRDEPFASGLQVWRFKGKNICQNNRRLYCLKQYQKGQVDDVMVKIHVTELGSVMEKFTSSMEPRDDLAREMTSRRREQSRAEQSRAIAGPRRYASATRVARPMAEE